MAICATCGNDYDKGSPSPGRRQDRDVRQRRMRGGELAPECAHCGCRILGHGIESPTRFSAAHTAHVRTATPTSTTATRCPRELPQRRMVATMPARYPSRATSDGRKRAAGPAQHDGGAGGRRAGRPPAWCPCRATPAAPSRRCRPALRRGRAAATASRRPGSRALRGCRRRARALTRSAGPRCTSRRAAPWALRRRGPAVSWASRRRRRCGR